VLSAAAGLAPSGPAWAEETQVRFDLPGAPLAFFGREYTADHLEGAGAGSVVSTRLVLRFETEAPAGSFHDAADLLVQLQLPTEGVPTWSIRGSDLGWSGTGSFGAEVDTTEFAGRLLDVEPGSFRLWFVRIVSDNPVQQQLGGQLTESFFEATIEVDGCRVDLTGDGVLDLFDFLEFQNLFEASDLAADFTGDGILDLFDFLAFQNEFGAGCP
jgi:hypothetical protein